MSTVRALLMPYVELMRLHRPVGIALCLLPTLWGLYLDTAHLHVTHAFLFILGATLMRGAGCTINDLLDCAYDRGVLRTAGRPIARGRISPTASLIFFGIQLALSCLILFWFNAFTRVLGVLIVMPVLVYPLFKRFTHWPQVFLGFVFNWGCLMGWSSVHESLSRPVFFLYLACVFWTIGYDTVYAFQDYKDDQRMGLGSSAVRLGYVWAKPFIFFCYSIFFSGLFVSLWCAQKKVLIAGLLPLVAVIFFHVKRLDMTFPQSCERFFKDNVLWGSTILAGLVVLNFVK